MTRLGQDKAGLAALDPEPVGEPGVVCTPVRRAGVDLSLQRLQLSRVLSGLAAIEQLERYVRHDHLPCSGIFVNNPAARCRPALATSACHLSCSGP